MKKHLFSKYVAMLLATCLAGFLLLAGFLSLYTMEYFSARETKELEDAALHANFAISSMMELTQQDFDFVLENQRDLIVSALALDATDGAGAFLVTDAMGRVVISYPEAEGDVIPAAVLTEATAMARQGAQYRTDLGGILNEEKNCKVLLLEKEFSDGHKQRVGAVFLLRTPALSESYTEGLILNFLVAGSVVFLFLILLYHFMTRDLVRPMRLLSEAASFYARGDFSRRLPEKEGGEMTPLLRAFNQMAEHVEENEKLRQTFVSNVSHDLRTPLTTIGGFVQNMASGAIPPEKQGHYYKIIIDEVNRLSRLVQTLLETSRMTAGERVYHFATMDLCELARITLLSFEQRLEQKKLEVSFDCDADSTFVLADRDAIQQVIYNLIDNAIKFTPEKGSLSLAVRLQKQKAIFEVKNSGEGIPEEELRHLFDRFYKSDRSRGLDKTGMGLGLFIAKTILAAHKEEIWVESKEGEYTSFLFSLELTDARASRRPAEAANHKEKG